MSIPIPNRMLVVLVNEGGGLSVGQMAIPHPGPGEILVRMAASPIHPSDLGFIKGQYGFTKPFPVVPGFEGSGTVVGAGSGLLPHLWMGKRVTCAASPSSGGAWAEYLVTSASFCFPLRKNLSFEQGAMLVVNPMTALAFFDIAKRGKHAAIVNNAAASALGQMILRLGLQRGIPVVNIVRRPEQVDLLRSQGAKYVLNSSDADFLPQLRSITHQLKATLLLDAVAGMQTQQLLEAAPDGSTVLIYARLSGEPALDNALSLPHKRVEGFFLGDWVGKKGVIQTLIDIQKVQQLASSVLSTKVQQRFPLSAVQQALDLYQKNRSAGKVLLVADPQAVPMGGSNRPSPRDGRA